jgi:hypothetical protein
MLGVRARQRIQHRKLVETRSCIQHILLMTRVEPEKK